MDGTSGAGSGADGAPKLLPGPSAAEIHAPYSRFGNIGVVLVLGIVASLALLPDPVRMVPAVLCLFGGWYVAYAQYQVSIATRQRLKEERAAGYQTLGGLLRPDIPLLDPKTGKVIRPRR